MKKISSTRILIFLISILSLIDAKSQVISIEPSAPGGTATYDELTKEINWTVYSGCQTFSGPCNSNSGYSLTIALVYSDEEEFLDHNAFFMGGLETTEYCIYDNEFHSGITNGRSTNIQITLDSTSRNSELFQIQYFASTFFEFSIKWSRPTSKIIDKIEYVNDGIEIKNDTLFACNVYPKLWNGGKYKIYSGNSTAYTAPGFNWEWWSGYAYINDQKTNYDINFDSLKNNDIIYHTAQFNTENCLFTTNGIFLKTQDLTVIKNENEETLITEIGREDTILCPGENNYIKKSTTNKWYDVNESIRIDENGLRTTRDAISDDSIYISTASYYVSAEERVSTECPNVSRAYRFETNDNCKGYINGYVRENVRINGIYNTFSNVTVRTNTNLVSVSDSTGFFEFYFDQDNKPDKIYVADPDYFQDEESLFFNSSFPIDEDEHLYTYLLENNDLTIHLTSGRNRPGFTIPYYVTVENRGKSDLKTNVSLDLDGGLSYSVTDGENTPSSINGQTLSWDSVSVASGQSTRLTIYATLNASTPLGSNLQSSAILDMSVIDDIEENNTITLESEVVGSFDPNDKLVTPQGGFTEGYVNDTTSFDYTIRFQNTGTDTAFTVRVEDVIDTDLNLASINMIDASHNYKMTISGDTVTWTFENIELLDSNSNEPLSHGFIRFNIKQKEDNPQGTEITNMASIFFDFNEPVLTNETINIVNNGIVTSLEEKQAKSLGKLNMYPNPVTDILNIQLPEEASFSLYNQLGELVFQSETIDNINLSDIETGVYFYQVQTAEKNYSGKILKK